jgi:putative endonuclease
LNEGIGHKNRIAKQFGFLSKAPFQVHSDCEARLDIPVPATKISQSLMTGFCIYKLYITSMFVVYVLYSVKHQKIYIGYTSALIDRFHSHNKFSTKGYTVKYRPWIVVHVEFFESKIAALKRKKSLFIFA